MLYTLQVCTDNGNNSRNLQFKTLSDVCARQATLRR
jgi:hypothetical protein